MNESDSRVNAFFRMLEAHENLELFLSLDYDIGTAELVQKEHCAENKMHLRELCKRMITTIDSLESIV